MPALPFPINHALRSRMLDEMALRQAGSWLADNSAISEVVRLDGIPCWQLEILKQHGDIISANSLEEMKEHAGRLAYLVPKVTEEMLEWVRARREFLQEGQMPGNMRPIIIEE